MKRFISACWLVPNIVALTFGSIVAVCLLVLVGMVVDRFDTSAGLAVITYGLLPTIIMATVYQRLWTVPRLSKSNLTGTTCHCLALFAILGGQYLVIERGAPALTTLWLVIAAYVTGGLLHLGFKSCDWQDRTIPPHFTRAR